MRVGEVCGLHVEDVNLENQLAHITTSKDGEDRTVPFTAGCASMIETYLANRPAYRLSHIFVGTRGRQIQGAFTVYGARIMISRRCRELGIAHTNPHSIRHMFATRALNAGMRVEVVSKILGHASVDFTLRVYASLLMETVQREYNRHWMP